MNCKKNMVRKDFPASASTRKTRADFNFHRARFTDCSEKMWFMNLGALQELSFHFKLIKYYWFSNFSEQALAFCFSEIWSFKAQHFPKRFANKTAFTFLYSKILRKFIKMLRKFTSAKSWQPNPKLYPRKYCIKFEKSVFYSKNPDHVVKFSKYPTPSLKFI